MQIEFRRHHKYLIHLNFKSKRSKLLKSFDDFSSGLQITKSSWIKFQLRSNLSNFNRKLSPTSFSTWIFLNFMISPASCRCSTFGWFEKKYVQKCWHKGSGKFYENSVNFLTGSFGGRAISVFAYTWLFTYVYNMLNRSLISDKNTVPLSRYGSNSDCYIIPYYISNGVFNILLCSTWLTLKSTFYSHLGPEPLDQSLDTSLMRNNGGGPSNALGNNMTDLPT